ncbi:MAG: helix-turn-helix domain-containing protein [Chloroflexota bacterium]
MRGSDVVALVGGASRDGRPATDATDDLGDDAWWGVAAGPVALEDVAAAYADAVDALRVAPSVLPPRTVADVRELALERALVAAPALASAGADRWLAPLEDAPRGGQELVRTLAAWLEAGQSVTATARALEVAPRTVSYRLDRVASLLGARSLTPDVVARLSAALLLARLLGRDRVASAP